METKAVFPSTATVSTSGCQLALTLPHTHSTHTGPSGQRGLLIYQEIFNPSRRGEYKERNVMDPAVKAHNDTEENTPELCITHCDCNLT